MHPSLSERASIFTRTLFPRLTASTGLPKWWANVLLTPIEPILHPSTARLRSIGLIAFVGMPFFCFIWMYVVPQPFESPLVRATMMMLALVLALNRFAKNVQSRETKVYFTFVCWVEFPIFFSWMYWMNNGNSVWLASMVAALLIYYHLTDWRLATIGTFSGAFFGLLCTVAMGHGIQVATALSDAIVLAFAWTTALVLGITSASRHREHLSNTLVTMGIMAHELRTPLSTMGLIGDALQLRADEDPGSSNSRMSARMSQKIQALVKTMNQQIDTQISNARMIHAPNTGDLLQASVIIADVLRDHPYRSERERQCVEFVVNSDFHFKSSAGLFSQVISNLLKNSLHSLLAASAPLRPSLVVIDVYNWEGRGVITIRDCGTGIKPEALSQVFEPFFSTSKSTGHGLGLAFCKRIVRSAKGTISVQSEFGLGATFTINLPTHPAPITEPASIAGV